MLTFLVYARKDPSVLARVVSLLRRRMVPVRTLTFGEAEKPDVVRMTIAIEAAREQAEWIEANLYRLIDVLVVESSDKAQLYSKAPSRSLTTIYVITTGGTIEKDYSEPTGSVANLDGKIHRYLRLLRLPNCDVRLVPLLNKDSLEMTDADRQLIFGTVEALFLENTPIVITHGTDRMVETGMYLQQRLGELKVPIVFTGAMVPLGFEGSDALQNLTESLFAARTLQPGIYVVIHGETFPIYRVRKDVLLGRFVWSDANVM